MLAIPLWVAVYLGVVALDFAIAPLLWHAHEMLFGFAIAVIIGFLLTAGKLWTGLDTPRGAALAGLVILWLAARLAAIIAPYPVYALLDLALLLVVGTLFARLIVQSRNWRNLPLAIVLLALMLANLAFHLAVSDIIGIAPMSALYAGLALVVLVECVMAGRVVPAFTMSATPGLQFTVSSALETAALSVTVIALGLWIFAPPGPVTAIALALASTLHLARQWQWHPLITRGRPILWILHAAYVWLAIGFMLLALAQVGWITVTAGVHALAIGATGGLIIGMMTRTARGHTGRPLQVTRAEAHAYRLIMLAAGLRVVIPLVAPQWLIGSLIATAVAWSLAFAIYLVIFGPWLVSSRVDGKDG